MSSEERALFELTFLDLIRAMGTGIVGGTASFAGLASSGHGALESTIVAYIAASGGIIVGFGAQQFLGFMDKFAVNLKESE